MRITFTLTIDDYFDASQVRDARSRLRPLISGLLASSASCSGVRPSKLGETSTEARGCGVSIERAFCLRAISDWALRRHRSHEVTRPLRKLSCRTRLIRGYGWSFWQSQMATQKGRPRESQCENLTILSAPLRRLTGNFGSDFRPPALTRPPLVLLKLL